MAITVTMIVGALVVRGGGRALAVGAGGDHGRRVGGRAAAAAAGRAPAHRPAHEPRRTLAAVRDRLRPIVWFGVRQAPLNYTETAIEYADTAVLGRLGVARLDRRLQPRVHAVPARGPGAGRAQPALLPDADRALPPRRARRDAARPPAQHALPDPAAAARPRRGWRRARPRCSPSSAPASTRPPPRCRSSSSPSCSTATAGRPAACWRRVDRPGVVSIVSVGTAVLNVGLCLALIPSLELTGAALANVARLAVRAPSRSWCIAARHAGRSAWTMTDPGFLARLVAACAVLAVAAAALRGAPARAGLAVPRRAAGAGGRAASCSGRSHARDDADGGARARRRPACGRSGCGAPCAVHARLARSRRSPLVERDGPPRRGARRRTRSSTHSRARRARAARAAGSSSSRVDGGAPGRPGRRRARGRRGARAGPSRRCRRCRWPRAGRRPPAPPWSPPASPRPAPSGIARLGITSTLAPRIASSTSSRRGSGPWNVVRSATPRRRACASSSPAARAAADDVEPRAPGSPAAPRAAPQRPFCSFSRPT